MQLIEHSVQRLVIQQRRLGILLVLGIFTLLSLLMALAVALGGMLGFGGLNPFEQIAWLVWTLVAATLAGVGWQLCYSIGHGVRCVFDREAGTCTIRRGVGFGIQETEHAIYSVSHLVLEKNEEVGVYGLFLILRSSERISLATVAPYDEHQTRDLIRTVRQFLLDPALPITAL